MSDKSNIGWTDATWSPITGCTYASPGCKNCYAEALSGRLAAMAMADIEAGRNPGKKANYLPVVNEHGRWTNKIFCDEQSLAIPLSWKKPRMIFVNSMSDTFHPDVPSEFIDRIFAVMALCPQHTFHVLTKRAERMAEYMTQREISNAWSPSRKSTDEAYKWKTPCDSVYRIARQIGSRETAPALVWPLPNVWLGCSVENQEWADKRIPWLLKTPAAVRFLSCEPLLGAIDLSRVPNTSPPMPGCPHRAPGRRVDWVIIGGESGGNRREMNMAHAVSIIYQCKAAGVPVFVKQDSGPKSGMKGRFSDEYWAPKQFPNHFRDAEKVT